MADLIMRKLSGNKRYVMGSCLGEGTFGVVCEAIDQVAHKPVAIKKLRPEEVSQEDLIVTPGNVTNLWEIHILRKLNHTNVIQLLDVYEHDNTHHLVFELMATDLSEIIRDPSITLSPADCKAYMQMFLQRLAYLHENSIIHRDLKPDNLLIEHDGQLKLADFGSACYCKNKEVFSTPRVFAITYRAPELLRGHAMYGAEVDMWAAGCIFASLISRRSFFTGKDEDAQLQQIFKRFRVPSETQSQSICVELEYRPIDNLRKVFPKTSENCLDLLQQMFACEPERRITAEQALEHMYFTSPPLPTPTSMLPQKDPTQTSSGLCLKAAKRKRIRIRTAMIRGICARRRL